MDFRVDFEVTSFFAADSVAGGWVFAHTCDQNRLGFGGISFSMFDEDGRRRRGEVGDVVGMEGKNELTSYFKASSILSIPPGECSPSPLAPQAVSNILL